jgi:NAD(P)-dependent dehydrogenase (short-subunit alcohol dehydrogenase family)
MRLHDKTAVITGGASGMGRAAAILFAREGASIVVADRVAEGGRETVSIIEKNGGKAVFSLCDVTDRQQIRDTVRLTVDTYGKLDILFNIAGRPQMTQKFEEISDEEWDGIYKVNVAGVRLFSKYALPELKKSQAASIINISSVGGDIPRPGSAAYATSKGAVLILTKVMAVEFAQYGIRVNCLMPGPTDTPMMSQFVKGYDDADKHDAIKKTIASSAPLGRFVQPEDIAYAGLFLASDEASAVTGLLMPVDCGTHLGNRSET